MHIIWLPYPISSPKTMIMKFKFQTAILIAVAVSLFAGCSNEKGTSVVDMDKLKVEIQAMEDAYAAADIVISRAGAIAIAELCVMKKPTLFVPFPYAAEDHQTVNAMSLVDKNAALIVRDSEAKDKVIPMIIDLAMDEGKQNELKNNIGQLAIADADSRIAEEILKLI